MIMKENCCTIYSHEPFCLKNLPQVEYVGLFISQMHDGRMVGLFLVWLRPMHVLTGLERGDFFRGRWDYWLRDGALSMEGAKERLISS